MKQIIKGKLYNTETAQKILEHTNSGIGGYYNEALYRKKTGEFFLKGSGDAFSKYSEPSGYNGRITSSKIIPLTEEETKQYLEDIDQPDIYMQFFEVEE